MTQLEVISWTLFFIVIIGGLWYHFKISNENNKKIDEIVNTIKEINTMSIKDNSSVVLPYDEDTIKYWLAYYENESKQKIKTTMKKYKLIKEYPGSPKLGYTIDESKLTSSGFFCQETNTWLYGVIDAPSYWQEIKQKKYEITSYKLRNGNWGTDNLIISRGSTIEELEKIYSKEAIKALQIYSVKRLSDNVEFKIGDIVLDALGKQEITSFIEEATYCFKSLDMYGVSGTGYIKNISHFKQPLFTTEDGVEIFKDDKYWVVRTDKFGSKEFHWDITGPEFGKDNIKYTQIANKEHGVFWFSTKEAAEQYIIENKPCLSLKDIVGYISNPLLFSYVSEYDGSRPPKNHKEYLNLIKIIKTKLKL